MRKSQRNGAKRRRLRRRPAGALPPVLVAGLLIAAGGAAGATTAPKAPMAAPGTATVHTATAPPAYTPSYVEESRQAFEGQLSAHQIAEAEFNKVAEHLHLHLRDGRYMFVSYPGREEPLLQAHLLRSGVPVTIEYTAVRHGAGHHTLRYMVSAVLIVVLLVLAALLVLRRRKLAGEGEGEGKGEGSGSA